MKDATDLACTLMGTAMVGSMLGCVWVGQMILTLVL